MLHYFRGESVHLCVKLDVSLFYRSLSQDSLLPGVIKQQLLSRSKGEIAYYNMKAFFKKKKNASVLLRKGRLF